VGGKNLGIFGWKAKGRSLVKPQNRAKLLKELKSAL
jgi:hypothetical protein